MSKLEIKRYEIEKIYNHPDPEVHSLELIKLKGMDFVLVSQKGLRRIGQQVLYCPQDAVLPEYLLKPGFWDEIKGKGLLSGKLGNRVKPKKIRGEVSIGILLSLQEEIVFSNGKIIGTRYWINKENNDPIEILEDVDYAKELGIKKYEVSVPATFSARHVGAFEDLTINYDFENILKDPDLFYEEKIEFGTKIALDGNEYPCKIRTADKTKPDEVWISHKAHGSLVQIIAVPHKDQNEKFYKNRITFSSKGLGAKGIVLDWTDESNVYVRAINKNNLFEKLYNFRIKNDSDIGDDSLIIFGEVIGSGVQDLTYGYQNGEVNILLFDAALVTNREHSKFLSFDNLKLLSEELDVPLVPVLYTGPFSPDKVKELTDLKEQISGNELHIGEGIVIKQYHPHWNEETQKWERKAAKSISESYYSRKGNQTEYQ